MLHRLCGPPSIPLSFSLAAVLPRRDTYCVSDGTAERLRHRYSSRYLRIPPLHREFHLPLPCSSPPVLPAAPELSPGISRSEEHTSELQSHVNLVCRLLLEKKKKKQTIILYINNKKKKKQN